MSQPTSVPESGGAPAPDPAGPPLGAAPPPEVSPPRRRRRGLVLAIVVIVLLVLAGLVVGGDRAAATAAQSVLARQLQADLKTPTTPQVQINGFPFLTQLASGKYKSVHVVADDATVPPDGEGKPLAIAHADVTLDDVTAENSGSSVTAGQVDATVRLSYAALTDQLGLTTESAGDGAIKVSFDVPVGSLQVKGTATARPVLDAGAQQITFEDASVSITSGSEGQAVADAVGQVVLRPITLADVPYGLKLRDLQVRDDGLEFAGSATNVPLSR